jgi:hypothetical protein
VHVDAPLAHRIEHLLVGLDDERHALVDRLEVAVCDDAGYLKRSRVRRKEGDQHEEGPVSPRRRGSRRPTEEAHLEQPVLGEVEARHLTVDPDERAVLLPASEAREVSIRLWPMSCTTSYRRTFSRTFLSERARTGGAMFSVGSVMAVRKERTTGGRTRAKVGSEREQ